MTLSERIDVIESGYEFMLAYGAQGRDTDRDASGSGVGFELREFLTKMEGALEGLGDAVSAAAADQDADLSGANAFLEAIGDDARKVQGMLRLVNAQSDISSRLIENVHIATHVRALLTDLFVVDEVFKGRREPE